MDRIIFISISLVISSLMYLAFVAALKTERGRNVLGSHWFFHPNAICLWRVIIGLSGVTLYFVAGQHALGILLFTISAVLDGVDGLVARECNLTSSFGEEIDPLCDKLTYLPPLVFFAYQGGVERCGGMGVAGHRGQRTISGQIYYQAFHYLFSGGE
jgi:CDP-diacylglycerol--serine O-phosphatidyltransferase